MSGYSRIACSDAHTLLTEGDRDAVIIADVRDPDSYAAGHIRGAIHLDNTGLTQLVETADTDVPVVVCCYHGHMSQAVGAMLAERGFAAVYSLDGGFTEWAGRYPESVARAGDPPG